MLYQVLYTERGEKDLEDLKRDRNKKRILKAVVKAIRLLSENPRHPSLKTHQYYSLPEVFPGQKIWEAHAQDKTPAAYRVFWTYGPAKDQISIVAITPHP